jgi:hypothetical protein
MIAIITLFFIIAKYFPPLFGIYIIFVGLKIIKNLRSSGHNHGTTRAPPGQKVPASEYPQAKPIISQDWKTMFGPKRRACRTAESFAIPEFDT